MAPIPKDSALCKECTHLDGCVKQYPDCGYFESTRARTAEDVAAYHARHKKKPEQTRVGEKPAAKKKEARMRLF